MPKFSRSLLFLGRGCCYHVGGVVELYAVDNTTVGNGVERQARETPALEEPCGNLRS